MGLNFTLLENDDSGKQFCPKHSLQTFPRNERFPRPAPGNLITYLRANPPDMRYDGADNESFWWVDCEFLSFRDDTILVCCGLYQERPGRAPVASCSQLQGTTYVLQFTDRVKCQRVREAKTSALPMVQSHPGGDAILYIQNGKVTLLNLATGHTVGKYPRHSARHAAVSPNGNYVAVVSRLGVHFELTILLNRDFLILTEESTTECHKLCPDFVGTRTYKEIAECRFSPDSMYLAVSSSMGHLLIVRCTSLKIKTHCSVIPGIIDRSRLLTNTRAFDFDPRYKHACLAVGLSDGCICVCDTDTQEILREWVVPAGDSKHSIDCVRYAPQARLLAVATSNAKILLYHPDLCELWYTLDGSTINTEAARMEQRGGRYPSVLKLAFSVTGDILLCSATDGIIRMWQLDPNLQLRHLCRTTVLQHCPLKKVKELPLPPAIIQDLLDWPSL